MASFIYQKGLHDLGGSGNLDIETASIGTEIYLALLTGTYPATDVERVDHYFYQDIIDGGWEINTGGGYTAGDASNAGGKAHGASEITTSRDDPNFGDQILVSDPVSWLASTITASYALGYWWTGGLAATSPLLFLWDFGGSRVTANRDFVVSWASGVMHTFGPCSA